MYTESVYMCTQIVYTVYMGYTYTVRDARANFSEVLSEAMKHDVFIKRGGNIFLVRLTPYDDFPVVEMDTKPSLPYEPEINMENGMKMLTIGLDNSKKPTENVRTQRDILNEINADKAQHAEDLKYCQDPETINELNKAFSERQAVLWEEWRSLQ